MGRTEISIRLKLNVLGHKHSDIISFKLSDVICINCKSPFLAPASDKRKFCSMSCSATFNNLKKLEHVVSRCGECQKTITKKRNFCDAKCYGKFKIKNSWIVIEKNGIVSDKKMKRYLIEKYGAKCMECDWNKIHPLTQKTPIQLEHIDGNSENTTVNNCKLLCPNCHSLTLTFGALNLGNGRAKRREYRNKHAAYA